jgi:uncharacterized protein (TIGR02646 family)
VRHIAKGREPASLTGHRLSAHASYDNCQVKDELRDALAREQGFLCCYCLRRIDPGASRIEHHEAQSTHPERQLDWRNMLVACDGGELGPAANRHCDVRKGDTPIQVDPTDAHHVARVKFDGNGRVTSTDAAIQRDLDETLNLNDERLVRTRRAALGDALRQLSRKHGAGNWSRDLLQRELARWRPRAVTERLPEFCEAVAQYIERRLR